MTESHTDSFGPIFAKACRGVLAGAGPTQQPPRGCFVSLASFRSRGERALAGVSSEGRCLARARRDATPLVASASRSATAPRRGTRVRAVEPCPPRRRALGTETGTGTAVRRARARPSASRPSPSPSASACRVARVAVARSPPPPPGRAPRSASRAPRPPRTTPTPPTRDPDRTRTPARPTTNPARAADSARSGAKPVAV